MRRNKIFLMVTMSVCVSRCHSDHGLHSLAMSPFIF